ncbi:MAG: histidinol-phosphatase HisJ family protein [Candidatus Aureabacteria bacterium]|nr:histidinol-phosphatase HisJ family protein [Candidatus Auribacterota bacterium]
MKIPLEDHIKVSSEDLQDWHIHDFVSHDAEGHVEDFVRVALQKHVKVICFVNHPERMDPSGLSFSIDVESVLEKLRLERQEIDRCRDCYEGDVEIYQGIELENRATLKEANKRLLRSHPFDVVVGSCHLIGERSISSKRHLSFFKGKREEDVYNAFFDETLRLLESFSFHVLAHFDIVKRYGVYYYGIFRPKKYKARIREIFQQLKEKNVGLEINTSGFFQGPREPYPGEALALEALEAGVPFVLTGSDAHSPGQLAGGFEQLHSRHRYNRGLNFKRIDRE